MTPSSPAAFRRPRPYLPGWEEALERELLHLLAAFISTAALAVALL